MINNESWGYYIMPNNEKRQQPITLRWMVMGSNELFGVSVCLSLFVLTQAWNNSVVFCHVTGEQRFVLCNLRMFAQVFLSSMGATHFPRIWVCCQASFSCTRSLSSKWTYGSGVQYCFFVVFCFLKLTVNVTCKVAFASMLIIDIIYLF